MGKGPVFFLSGVLVNSSPFETFTMSQLCVPDPHAKILISKTIVLEGGETGHDYPMSGVSA